MSLTASGWTKKGIFSFTVGAKGHLGNMLRNDFERDRGWGAILEVGDKKKTVFASTGQPNPSSTPLLLAASTARTLGRFLKLMGHFMIVSLQSLLHIIYVIYTGNSRTHYYSEIHIHSNKYLTAALFSRLHKANITRTSDLTCIFKTNLMHVLWGFHGYPVRRYLFPPARAGAKPSPRLFVALPHLQAK